MSTERITDPARIRDLREIQQEQQRTAEQEHLIRHGAHMTYEALADVALAAIDNDR